MVAAKIENNRQACNFSPSGTGENQIAAPMPMARSPFQSLVFILYLLLIEFGFEMICNRYAGRTTWRIKSPL
jgi:hypothetical protein